MRYLLGILIFNCTSSLDESVMLNWKIGILRISRSSRMKWVTTKNTKHNTAPYILKISLGIPIGNYIIISLNISIPGRIILFLIPNLGNFLSPKVLFSMFFESIISFKFLMFFLCFIFFI